MSGGVTDQGSGEQEPVAMCGFKTEGGFRIGCQQPIATIHGLYRCATCDVAMHKTCLAAHFNYRDEIPPSPSNLERLILAERKAEALLASNARQKEALRNRHALDKLGYIVEFPLNHDEWVRLLANPVALAEYLEDTTKAREEIIEACARAALGDS